MPIKIEESVILSEKMDICDEASSSEENVVVESLTATDKAKIEAILSSNVGADEMRVTLEKLPESVTLVLLQSMQHLLSKKVNYTQTCISWLKVLLEVHESVMDDPKCKVQLNEVRASLHSALTLRNPLNNLKGKLDLLLYQADAKLVDGQIQEPLETLDFSDNSDEDTNNVIQTNNGDKVLVWDDLSEEEVEKSDEEMDQENISDNSEDEQDVSELSNNESE